MNIHKKLEEFATLDKGWNFNEGEKFDKDVLDTAKTISDYCESIGYNDQEIFPGSSGNILLSIYNGEDEIEIEVYENLNFMYLYFSEDHDKYMDEYDCETTNLETLKQHILKIKEVTKN